jgi:hypothetical protein
MAKIIDPDQLSQATEIIFDTTGKTIQLLKAGNLSDDGVTLQAVYSFCKEEWKDDANLIKLPFPLEAITEAKFDVINGWDWDDQTTRELIRDGGWSLRDAVGVSQEEYFGFITLGLMNDPLADQAYYQQVAGNTASTTDTVYTGPVNEAVKVYGDATHGDFDYRDFFTAFLREQGKVYSQSSLAEQAVNVIDYTVYKLPLANALDPKIVAADIDIDDGGLQGVYANMKISYLIGDGFTLWVSGTSYTPGDVVQSPINDRWYRCLIATSGTTDPSADGTNWESYIGERQIGADWYPFNVIVDADGQVAERVYEFTQYRNRQASNINDDVPTDGFGNVNGNIAPQLLSFLGDTLVTGTGVFVDDFNSNDTNRIEFRDANGSSQTFPFVAAGTINFNDNLQNDASAKYWMFFNTNPGGNYGTTNAIIVNDNSGTPITGLVNSQAFVNWTFDYDGNIQGGRTPATDAGVVVVAIGLSTAQFVRLNGTIGRSVGQTFSLVSALERNYSNPV